jgi:hypothetical protein
MQRKRKRVALGLLRGIDPRRRASAGGRFQLFELLSEVYRRVGELESRGGTRRTRRVACLLTLDLIL